MTTRTTPAKQFTEAPIPVQAKLAAAWTSFMFLYIYVDYLHLYKPGIIDAIRAGIVHEFEISVTFALITIVLLAVPILMILLSVTLPPRANRITNLIVATLYVPFSAYNATGGSSWLSFYLLAITIEVLLLAFILRSAWTWPRTPTLPTGLVTDDPRQDLHHRRVHL